jgi:hypothetical protein
MRKRTSVALVWKTVIVIATVVVLSGGPAHTATPSRRTPGFVSEQQRPGDALAIGVEAYIYGYPLVLMGATERVETNVPHVMPTRAPKNQFVKEQQLPNASFTDVVLPSTSTLYSTAWLDLSQEPVILHLPYMTGRFFVIQVLDAWTNVGGLDPNCLQGAPGFCSLGTRYGTPEGDYAFIGPDWQGTLPAGITQVIQMPTNMVWIIGRTYTQGSEDDVKFVVQQLFSQFTLTPLSSYGQTYTPPTNVPVDPMVDMGTTPLRQVANMDACAFFGTLAALMTFNMPLPSVDAPTIARLASIGLVPGESFDCGQLDRATRTALQLAVQAGQRILGNAPLPSLTETGWAMPLGLGTYGTEYLLRALIAQDALGANNYQDAIYAGASQDSAGNELIGAHRYVLHFAAGQLPPANPQAFWSVTMYNNTDENKENLVTNPIGRSALGLPMIEGHVPCFNDDGSLDFYIQADPPPDPTSVQYCNWLPAPTDKFLLFLRMYWPDPVVHAGQWVPPAVQRVD